jgi:hypothetical protein
MRDIFVVLGEKEAELKKLQSEIETLRAAARLLTDENESPRRATTDAMLSVVGEGASPREARVAAGGLKQFP